MSKKSEPPDLAVDQAFAATGGKTNLWQPLIGVFVISTAKHLGAFWLPDSWEPTLTFAIMLLALLLNPAWSKASTPQTGSW